MRSSQHSVSVKRTVTFADVRSGDAGREQPYEQVATAETTPGSEHGARDTKGAVREGDSPTATVDDASGNSSGNGERHSDSATDGNGRASTTPASNGEAPRKPKLSVETKKVSQLRRSPHSARSTGTWRTYSRRFSTGSAPVHIAPDTKENESFEQYLRRFLNRYGALVPVLCVWCVWRCIWLRVDVVVVFIVRRERFRRALSNGMVQPEMARLWPMLFKAPTPTDDKPAISSRRSGLRRSRSWDAPFLSSAGSMGGGYSSPSARSHGGRIDEAGINAVPTTDRRIVRTRTIMRNRRDTLYGAGVAVSTVKAMVREGQPDGVVYVLALESKPRDVVRGHTTTSSLLHCLLTSTPVVAWAYAGESENRHVNDG